MSKISGNKTQSPNIDSKYIENVFNIDNHKIPINSGNKTKNVNGSHEAHWGGEGRVYRLTKAKLNRPVNDDHKDKFDELNRQIIPMTLLPHSCIPVVKYSCFLEETKVVAKTRMNTTDGDSNSAGIIQPAYYLFNPRISPDHPVAKQLVDILQKKSEANKVALSRSENNLASVVPNEIDDLILTIFEPRGVELASKNTRFKYYKYAPISQHNLTKTPNGEPLYPGLTMEEATAKGMDEANEIETKIFIPYVMFTNPELNVQEEMFISGTTPDGSPKFTSLPLVDTYALKYIDTAVKDYVNKAKIAMKNGGFMFFVPNSGLTKKYNDKKTELDAMTPEEREKWGVSHCNIAHPLPIDNYRYHYASSGYAIENAIAKPRGKVSQFENIKIVQFADLDMIESNMFVFVEDKIFNGLLARTAEYNDGTYTLNVARLILKIFEKGVQIHPLTKEARIAYMENNKKK